MHFRYYVYNRFCVHGRRLQLTKSSCTAHRSCALHLLDRVASSPAGDAACVISIMYVRNVSTYTVPPVRMLEPHATLTRMTYLLYVYLRTYLLEPHRHPSKRVACVAAIA